MRSGVWERRGLALVALLAILGGAVFRGFRLFHDPLWLDEAYSAYAAAGGWHFLWHVVPQYETHPPVYYSLVRLWTLAFGNGLPALRSLGLVAGLLVLPATWWAARGLPWGARALQRRTALAALILVAFAPALIEMSREVRPYAVMALVYAVALGALLRAMHPLGPDRRIARPPFALYCAALACMLWLHSLGPLYGLSLGLGALCLFVRRSLPRREWGVFAGGHVAAGLAYLPGVLILADQAPTWIHKTWLTFELGPGLLWTLALIWGAGGRPTLGVILLLAILAGMTVWRMPDGRRVAAALVIAATLPVVLSIAISMLIAPVFITRTMTPVGVPAALLLALAIGGTPPGTRRWVGWVAGALLVAQMISSDVELRRTEKPKQDWYAALDWLAPRFRAGDVVLAYPNEGALPFARALRDRRLLMPTRPIPGPVPTFADAPGMWNPTGSRGVVSLSRARLHAIATAPATRAIPTIWLLRLGPWAYDKGDVFQEELSADRIETGHVLIGPIDIIGLRNPAAPALTPAGRAAPAAAAAAR